MSFKKPNKIGKSKKIFGVQGENYASRFLQKNDYTILERNFRSEVGEIDIVAIDNKTKYPTLCFIEVKSRKTRKYGRPEEAVNKHRLYRLKRAGEYYSILHPEAPKKKRIDVVAIEVEKSKVIGAKIIKAY